MSRKMLVITSLAISSILIPYTTFAADSGSSATTTQSTKASEEMPKDAWLSSMIPLLPDLICKGFLADADLKKRFDELKITFDDCVKMIPESSTKCQNQLYSSIPNTINDESAGTWGRSLGECIGKDFAEKHLIPKS